MDSGVENRAQERIFGPKSEEVHTFPIIIKKGEMFKVCRMHGKDEK